MTRPLPGAADGPHSHDARAWVARRRRLLEQIDVALRHAELTSGSDAGGGGSCSLVAETLQRVRGELRRDVSVADVDAATVPHLGVVDVSNPPTEQRAARRSHEHRPGPDDHTPHR